MKLLRLIDQILQESAKSPAAKEAEKMGLVYMGYGKYCHPDDPHTAVAQTIQGHLVKIDPNEKKEPTTAPAAGAPVGATAVAPAAGTPTPAPGESEDPADSIEADKAARDHEPEVPATRDAVIDRLVNSAGGNYLKVQVALANRYRAGSLAAKDLLDRVKEHEAAAKAELQASIARTQAAKEKVVQDRKAKYATKYPSPKI